MIWKKQEALHVRNCKYDIQKSRKIEGTLCGLDYYGRYKRTLECMNTEVYPCAILYSYTLKHNIPLAVLFLGIFPFPLAFNVLIFYCI
jgi:hypothetical protein